MILQKLNELSEHSGRLDKENILKEIRASEKYNKLFSDVCHMAYDPRISYYIDDITMPDDYSGDITLNDALVMLKSRIAERGITGNAAKDYITNMLLSQLTEEDAQVLVRVIKHDLKCGVGPGTINKVWPDLIYQHPYMRCESFNEKNLKRIKYPCYSQLKADGLYCDIIVKSGSVTYMSRYGSVLALNDAVRDAYLIEIDALDNGYVLQGEVLVYEEDGSLMPRESSNGYINSDDKDISRVKFIVWDVIEHDAFIKCSDDIPYSERFESLINKFSECEHVGIEVVNTVVCTSFSDIVDHFTEVRENGEEGVVLKNFSGLWKDHTSKDQVKVKVIIEVDLKVVGFKYGEFSTKYEKMLGGLICRSADDLLEVSVGGGFSDKERTDILDVVEEWVANGQIITVKCNGVVKDKNKEGSLYSLFLPRYKESRMDKFEADTLDSIQEQENSFTDILKLIG